MAKVVDGDGLNPQEAQACVYRATGLSQSDAYRRAFNVKRIKPETVWNKASKLFSRGEVQARVREHLINSKLADIESLGEASQKLLDDTEAARKADNHNAVMGFTRIKMQMHGALKDAVSLSVESRMDDDALLKIMCGGDVSLLPAARKMLGAPDTFDVDPDDLPEANSGTVSRPN